MWFLIAQILLLLLLAAALGAALGVWWVKRRYEDVTEAHDDLLMQANKLDALGRMPTRDDLKAGLGEVSSSVAALRMPDLTPVETRLGRVEDAVKSFVVPPPDFAPIQRRLELIESILKAPDIALDQVRTRMGSIEASLGQVSQSVSRLANPDLAPLQAKLSDLETAFLSMKLPEVDLGPVHASLARLGLSVDHLKTTSNVGSIAAQLGQVETALHDMGGRLENVHVASLQAQLSQLETALTDMGGRLENLHKADLDGVTLRLGALNDAVAGMKPIDLDPLHRRFAAMEQAVGAIQPEIEQQHRRALAPMERRMAGLQEALGSMPETDLAPVLEAVHAIDSREDLVAVENRLTAIEYSLAAVHHMLRSRAEAALMQPWQARPSAAPGNGDNRTPLASPRPPREMDPINAVRRPGPVANLLLEPAFGPPDNLELIHGVGPILRSILNDRGIYYFWQVAEWSPDDAAQIDAQLMEFRGRIRRDDWIRHAAQLAALPTSAKRPMSQYGRRDPP